MTLVCESKSLSNIWALVPASGIGKRMSADIAKQYLPLADQTVLDVTLSRLLSFSPLKGLMLVIADSDEYFERSRYAQYPTVHTARGGKERSDSVINGLRALLDIAEADDWVMVHDAARPCVRLTDLNALVEASMANSIGALLGISSQDTIKQVVDGSLIVDKTLPRNLIWRAFTPQMFQIGALLEALEQAVKAGAEITDEASAMDLAGFSPELIEGASDNIKITRPADLALAEWFLDQQTKGLT